MVIVHDVFIFETINDVMSNHAAQKVDNKHDIRTDHYDYPL